MAPDERGRRAPTPAALASLSTVPEGYRVLPDPLHGQPLLRVPARPCDVRVLLDRSFESAQAGEPTQDYLAVRCDPRRLTFAVTDGVGSSFLGDVAAQILAAHLTDWLAPRPRGTAAFERDLDAFLRELSREVVDRVANWPLPESLSGLVRSALDQQRAYGSEAMFACGAVDLAGRDAVVTVAWLGDTHVRVIMRDGRHIHHSGQTADRWSSRLGPRGTVHTRAWPAAEVARVLVCTDGLRPELDAALELPDDQLGAKLTALARRPGNDDIALIDVGVAPRAMPAGDPVPGETPLWRRLTEEPQGRHARPTQTGSVLRRFFRAIGTPEQAEPAAAPTPTTPTAAATAAVPTAAPTAGVPTAAAPAFPAPSTGAPTAGAPAVGRAVGTASVPAQTAPPPVQSTMDLEEPRRGPAPPASVRWQDHEVTWSPVPGADSYSVQICREPTFAEPLLYVVPGVTFTVPRLPGPTYVRLRCVAAGEPGPWSDVHDLSAQPPAGAGAP
jgi:Protein phosphatase 2C